MNEKMKNLLKNDTQIKKEEEKIKKGTIKMMKEMGAKSEIILMLNIWIIIYYYKKVKD